MDPKGYEFKTGFLKKSSFNYMWISSGIAKKTIQNKIPEFYPFNLPRFL